jgi:hypothetical protein
MPGGPPVVFGACPGSLQWQEIEGLFETASRIGDLPEVPFSYRHDEPVSLCKKATLVFAAIDNSKRLASPRVYGSLG